MGVEGGTEVKVAEAKGAEEKKEEAGAEEKEEEKFERE